MSPVLLVGADTNVSSSLNTVDAAPSVDTALGAPSEQYCHT